VPSLNVSVAAAVVMYEAARQRRKKVSKVSKVSEVSK
jgi:tRNA(Leu) C34 or U34 (ribose-2'-O)-methylase TrmL